VFELFPDEWTPVAFAREIRRGRAKKVPVAGEDLAILRDQEGKLAALID
jgi:phenylpropionate dioxygenase-like ring-hydroxylating dioxygenase large terminal subunit